jgi:hypothetical protein
MVWARLFQSSPPVFSTLGYWLLHYTNSIIFIDVIKCRHLHLLWAVIPAGVVCRSVRQLQRDENRLHQDASFDINTELRNSQSTWVLITQTFPGKSYCTIIVSTFSLALYRSQATQRSFCMYDARDNDQPACYSKNDNNGTVLYLHLYMFKQLKLGYNCSVSRWRPQKVDKRMVLEYTHGLFIT